MLRVEVEARTASAQNAQPVNSRKPHVGRVAIVVRGQDEVRAQVRLQVQLPKSNKNTTDPS